MNSAIDFTNKTFVVAGAGGIGAATAKTLKCCVNGYIYLFFY